MLLSGLEYHAEQVTVYVVIGFRAVTLMLGTKCINLLKKI